MAIFPRPVSPTSAFADLREMFSPERPHRWAILALSMALTGFLLWGFALDSRRPPQEREIYYVESWMSDRKDSDIIRRQIEDIAKYETALASKQKEFQNVADGLGIEWRADAERNREQRAALIALIEKRLREKLVEALAREKREGKAPTLAAAPDAGTAR